MSENEVTRTGMDMISRHRFRLADDGNCAEIDSSGLAEEIDTALTAAEARIKMLEEALGNVAVLVKHADENFRSEDYGVAYPALAVAVETARQALTGASNDG